MRKVCWLVNHFDLKAIVSHFSKVRPEDGGDDWNARFVKRKDAHGSDGTTPNNKHAG